MDSQKSRKIIVASGMAAVLGIGVVTFALTHHPTSAAQISPSPAIVPPTRDVPAAVAPISEAPAVVAQIPDAPVVAHKDSVGSKFHHLAKAPTSADTTDGVVTPVEPPVDSSEKSPAETLPQSLDGGKSIDEVTPPSAGTATDAQQGAASTEPVASDAGPSRPR